MAPPKLEAPHNIDARAFALDPDSLRPGFKLRRIRAIEPISLRRCPRQRLAELELGERKSEQQRPGPFRQRIDQRQRGALSSALSASRRFRLESLYFAGLLD